MISDGRTGQEKAVSSEMLKLRPQSYASEYLQISVATLARWRCEGKGPTYIKIGRSVFYTDEALEAFVEASHRSSTRATKSALPGSAR